AGGLHPLRHADLAMVLLLRLHPCRRWCGMNDAWSLPAESGADLLDDVEMFLSRFVAYPSDAARVAHVLWIAHTWFMDEWDSTPRIAFLSPEPGSGKSRALEVTEPLVPRPLHAV